MLAAAHHSVLEKIDKCFALLAFFITACGELQHDQRASEHNAAACHKACKS